MHDFYGPPLPAVLDTPHTQPVPVELLRALIEQGICRRAKETWLTFTDRKQAIESLSPPGTCPFCDAVLLAVIGR